LESTGIDLKNLIGTNPPHPWSTHTRWFNISPGFEAKKIWDKGKKEINY